MERPFGSLPRIRQGDTGAGMPSTELCRPERIIGEQEILDRMGTVLRRSQPVTGGHGVHVAVVTRLHLGPIRPLQHGADLGNWPARADFSGTGTIATGGHVGLRHVPYRPPATLSPSSGR